MVSTGLPPDVTPSATGHGPASGRDVPERQSINGVYSDSFGFVRPPSSGVLRGPAWARHHRVATWHRPYTMCLLVADIVAIIVADVLALQLVGGGLNTFRLDVPHADLVLDLLAYAILPVVWVVVLWAHGTYDRRYLGMGTDEFKRIIRASVVMMAATSFLAFTIKAGDLLSRVSVGIALGGGMLLILVLRFALRRILHLVRGRGGASHRLLLIGTLSETLEVHRAITRTKFAGMVPVAIHLTDARSVGSRRKAPVPVYANRDVISLVQEIGADTVAVCGSASGDRADLRRLAWQLEGTGVDLVVAPQLTDIAGPRVHIRPVEGLPLLYVEEPKLSGPAWVIKNLADRFVAGMGLIVVSPVMLLIAILVKLGDGGPVFFRQRRAGREGKIFRVWKFRTMYADAEERLASLQALNEGDGMLFKMKRDPRVTRVGRLLRASSLDELPQLINVLVGDMSLVGPRPLPAEDGDFLGDVRRRLLVRPGITGLWQVSGRSDLSWDDAVRLDLYYVDNWSLAFDLFILWRTIGVVLRRKGAY